MRKILFILFLFPFLLSAQTVVRYRTVYKDTSKVFSTNYGTLDSLHHKSREWFYRPVRFDSTITIGGFSFDTANIVTKNTTQVITSPKHLTARWFGTSFALDTILDKSNNGGIIIDDTLNVLRVGKFEDYVLWTGTSSSIPSGNKGIYGTTDSLVISVPKNLTIKLDNDNDGGNVVEVIDGEGVTRVALTETGAITAKGSTASLEFESRSVGGRWGIFGSGGTAFLYNGATNVVEVDSSDGDLRADGNITAGGDLITTDDLFINSTSPEIVHIGSGTSFAIRTNNDTYRLSLAGGSAVSASSSAFILIHGNQFASADSGKLILSSGTDNGTIRDIEFKLGGATRAIADGITWHWTLGTTKGTGLYDLYLNDLIASGNGTFTGDAAVNGGDFTSSATTFNFLTSTVTTFNGFQAGTANTLGATTGKTTIRNDTLMVEGDIKMQTAGQGLYIKEGTNATLGVATLSAGTVTVNTTKVTASSRIFLTIDGGTLTNVGATYVSARVAGTSFTISSTNVLDASDVAWLIIEPTTN